MKPITLFIFALLSSPAQVASASEPNDAPPAESPDEAPKVAVEVVFTGPIGARLSIDGTDEGSLPQVRTLSPGAHSFEVTPHGQKSAHPTELEASVT